MNGWIKINRSILEWEHFTEPSVVTVFLTLLMTAERDGKTDIKLDELMKYTGMSHNTVNRCIAKLVKSGEITREKKGQNIFTTITNWSKFQGQSLTQKLGECNDLSTQNLGEQEDAIIPKNGTIIHPKNGTIIHPKIGSTIYNKNNNKNNKNNSLEMRARMREEVMQDMMVETGCRSVGITVEQYNTIAEEIFNDWTFQNLPDNEWTKGHFLAVMRIKANVKRNGQQQNNKKY
jgi:predicted transcriptional regulator